MSYNKNHLCSTLKDVSHLLSSNKTLTHNHFQNAIQNPQVKSEASVQSIKDFSHNRIQKDTRKVSNKKATVISNNSNSITQNTVIINDTIQEVSTI